MRIAVYGAGGFTGGLVVEELGRRGAEVVPVGRRGPVVAPLDDPDALVAAFRGCAVVVSAVAPFAAHGEPVLRAALAAGCHYLDTSGEQWFVKEVFDGFAGAAVEAGVTAVPAATDDGVPGDLVAHLVARELGEVDVLTVADLRQASGAASRGTGRSMALAGDRLTTGAFQYSRGEWRTDLVVEADEVGPGAVAFGLPGTITVPRHVTARRVQGVVLPDLAAAFGGLTAEFAETLPPVLGEEERHTNEWRMAAFATAPDGRRARGAAWGTDPYGTTAVVAAELALRLAEGDVRPGVLAPAQVVEPAGFLDRLGVGWEVVG
ncbi:saccharopine dehydrogenase NADP-binding domain-containing protein [Saccharothrix syringae]|uniref:saccharopine dehydrogenase NADP-binding domain-containing protein n=1 Tax=Saccharothrix syringae TaxID=103733 RepID=UPI000525D6FC|nr:saccharopine dehydrogenase NADP-binding domain-containing protein [Saccharothrix syringae]